jgi:hypothetical protein
VTQPPQLVPSNNHPPTPTLGRAHWAVPKAVYSLLLLLLGWLWWVTLGH